MQQQRNKSQKGETLFWLSVSCGDVDSGASHSDVDWKGWLDGKSTCEKKKFFARNLLSFGCFSLVREKIGTSRCWSTKVLNRQWQKKIVSEIFSILCTKIYLAQVFTGCDLIDLLWEKLKTLFFCFFMFLFFNNNNIGSNFDSFSFHFSHFFHFWS